MRSLVLVGLATVILSVIRVPVYGQVYGETASAEPGDEMIQTYLTRITETLHGRFMQGVDSAEDWIRQRPRFKREYLYMLGLWPLPPKTDLNVTITGTYPGEGFVVDMLHYQSRPHLYVTANLYRPERVKAGQRLPAVLYVCGHASRGRNGNKTAFQSHGIWFARHGYICLILDTLQLGEIAAIHHGTYRENRWWWHSRGYTPAGVEYLNGVRGIDYLISRPDVDPERIAVTGISGGGAATFWIAADERVKVAVPVSGMADLMSYIPNRVVNEHCDCMFLYNTFQWPWTRIAALVAPRALLFVNSDHDSLFPMDANERVINRLERFYSLFGASERVDSVVSIGGHAYREDIRKAVYRFINMHLKNDARYVQDSEVDLVTGSNGPDHPIEPRRLRVFPEDEDIPADELNTTIDRHFVPMARVELPVPGQYDAWKAEILAELRRVTFRYFPELIPVAKRPQRVGSRDIRLTSEPEIRIRLRRISNMDQPQDGGRVLMVVQNPEVNAPALDWVDPVVTPKDCVYVCEARGIGLTRWRRKNPPNYVRRSHVLLGRTVDTGRVWDIIAAARTLRSQYRDSTEVYVLGRGTAGVLAIYAALWEPDITGVILNDPPLSHMDPTAPAFLNVLRVCDIPEVMGMLAPREFIVYGAQDDALRRVAEIYRAAGAAERFTLRPPRSSKPTM